ncbi:MAG TPA: CNNM domain-containing protein [Candidatus Hydrothermia bacterium]|nr:CNNM domain-containing protein [Candidatus Hydrothermia bacterium]MDD5572187.1 CNNM domain-containing protein [Candidatus Hydrothermia bacterium]HRD23281.1 CNNM domain-containing protein [Candidatus Hydrothermia bacterium]
MIWLLILLLCLLMTFIFSAYETAYLVAQRKSFVGIKAGYRSFLFNVEDVMTTILVGVNFFETASSIVAFSFLKSVGFTTANAVGIAGILTSLVLLILEFFAKNSARRASILVLTYFTPFFKYFSYIAVPINRLVLFIISPLRALSGKVRRDQFELLRLMVSESVIDGELDSERARLILSFSRWNDLKVIDFSEPLEDFVVDFSSEDDSFVGKKGPILVREGDSVIGVLDFKKYFFTHNIRDSIAKVPVLSWETSLDEAVKILEEQDEKVALVRSKNKVKVFYVNTFLDKILGVSDGKNV